MSDSNQNPTERIRYVALNCTLKGGSEASSTDRILDVITGYLEQHGCTGERVRVRDHNVAFGVSDDEGDGDGWPAIRSKILDSQILVFGTPIWMGHPASVSQQVMERLDAFFADIDDRGQIATVDRVAIVGVVGNEDGAHHVGAELFQGLNDTGFTLPPGAMTYWVGEAMQKTDFKDLDQVPEKTDTTAKTMVRNAVHLARLIAGAPYPSLD